MAKSAGAFRTISEAADEVGVPQHVLRFWETKFTFIKPMKRAGGRRLYRPADIAVLEHPLNGKHGRAPQLAAWSLLRATRASLGDGPVLLVASSNDVAFRDLLAHYHALCRQLGPLPPAQVLTALGQNPESPPLPQWIRDWIAADHERPWPPQR